MHDMLNRLRRSQFRVNTNLWEDRIKAPDMKIADYSKKDNIRSFKLIAQPIKHNILSEITIDALGYNNVTPGPLIIVRQGEWIHLTVENKLSEPTALHVHGLSKPNSQDGIPDITELKPRKPRSC